MTDKTLDRIADALEKLVDAYSQAQRRDHFALTDRYAANEARQREEAEPDPLDEDDHRDRLDRDGERWTRIAPRWWVQKGVERSGPFSTPRGIDVLHGPLTFAPDASPAPQDAAQGDAGGTGDAVPLEAHLVTFDARRLTWGRGAPTGAEVRAWLEALPAGEFATGFLTVADALDGKPWAIPGLHDAVEGDA